MNSKIESLLAPILGLSEKKASPAAEEQKPTEELQVLLADRNSERQDLVKAARLILAERPDLEGELQHWLTFSSLTGASPAEMRSKLLAISKLPKRVKSGPW